MKKALVIVHGGGSWNDYGKYLDFLQNIAEVEAYEPVDPAFARGWKETLRDNAYAKGWMVFSPAFPCKQNAKYDEWKIILDKAVAAVPQDFEITFVGHSLGGNMLIKYLAENDVSQEVAGIHLVAACYDEGSFSNPPDAGWQKLASMANVHVWQAKDDTMVPMATAEHIHGRLPNSEYHLFETGGHFRMPEFPELEGVVFG